jgi:glycerol-3-phosphate dehydrogenase
MKNPLAIGAGIVEGLGFGYNTMAALVTRGCSEMRRLSLVMGGRPETLGKCAC